MSSLKYLALALLPCVIGTPAAADETDARATALLAAAKAAAGGGAWDKVTTWHERGKLHASGLDGTYESWDDLPGLRDAGLYALGPSSGGQGWDGRQAWSTDSSREVRIQDGAEDLAEAVQDVYRSSFAFFFPHRYAAKIEEAGGRNADGKPYDALRITPEGAEPFELWLDSATHLIAREVQLTGPQPHTFIFSDWRRVQGIMTPWRTIDRTAGNPKYDVIAVTASIDLSRPISDRSFAPPPPPKNDAEWPAGKSSVTVPFELINNHIYVEASIDGGPPRKFVFDTGATDLLDTGHAASLGIKPEGALPGGGFGNAVSAYGFARIKSVSLGGLTLHDQVFGAIDLASLVSVEGADLTGLLGYEFVKRADLAIDYARRTMVFTKPAAFQPPAGVEKVKFKFDEHTPVVEAGIDGLAGEFEIDTGARSALTIMHPFADAHGLIDKYHATHSATVGYGVGGPTRALLARVGSLVIGPVSLNAPVTEFVTDAHGAAAASRTAGNIGGDLLRRFTLTLDYAHQLLWLQPNALAGRPDVFDRSGLWIRRDSDGTIAIADVAKDSAADSAGLTPSDAIVAIDGKPAAETDLKALRHRFKQAPGTRIVLTVRSKTGERRVELTLADQI